MSDQHHLIDYVELPAPDLDAAQAFYAAAFGWTFNDYGGAYAGIRRSSGEGEFGGLNPEGVPGANGPLVLLWSDDLDATLGAVEAAGGTITVVPFAFPGGRRFHFSDPAGNELGVFGAA